MVWHPSLLQEEVDPGVDDGDHHQREDELEDTREDSVPGQDVNRAYLYACILPYSVLFAQGSVSTLTPVLTMGSQIKI